jgi:hypothetical protein
LRDWILPGGDVDPAAGEADHLMKEADTNKVYYICVFNGIYFEKTKPNGKTN